MSLFIIVEGVDSTGKSSLAKFLARRLDAIYWHSSGHRDLHIPMETYHADILHNIEKNLANGHDVVLDRHWPSQLVYAPVLRPNTLTKYGGLKMELKCDEMGAEYIFCDSEVGWDRYVQTHADHDAKVYHQLLRPEYETLRTEYKKLFAGLEHHAYSIEENGHDLERFVGRFI